MGIFSSVTLLWNGESYIIPPDKIMGMISEIEDKVPMSRLISKDIPFAKVAMAYGAALRYAGAKVEDDEVYASLFGDKGAGIVNAVSGLLSMMVPPQRIANDPPGNQAKKAKQVKGS